jgi:hypothetical protein
MKPRPTVRPGPVDEANPNSRQPSLPPWFGLLLVLALYSALVWSLTPTNYFGFTEDDSLYFSSGKALADGQGYIMPSLPGSPQATKYPVFYPWLMSFIWRASPSFPENLKIAIGFNVACGFAFLGIAFVFLRTIRSLTDIEALLITALCAIHPALLFHSANALPEVLFAALSLGAILLATRGTSREGHAFETTGAGILSGLALLTRSLGIPIATGLFLAALTRNGWRKSLYFAAGAFPFEAFSLWRSAHLAPAAIPYAATPCTNVVRMSWLYYTSYIGFWKADVLHGSGLLHVLRQNLVLLFLQPGAYLADPATMQSELFAFAPAVILSVAAICGLARRLGPEGWQPIHFALLLYAIPLALWNYPVMERFLLPFLPLFIAGVWLEAKPLLRRLATDVMNPKQAGPDRATGAAIFLSLVLLALSFSLIRSYWTETATIRRISATRQKLLSEKREAYTWLTRNTSAETKIVAYEDASLFLYTNRRAIRPVIFSPSSITHPLHLEAELNCMTATAKATGATYWLAADDDFGFEWELAATRGRSREAELESAWSQIFRSAGGRVRLYQLPVANPAYRTFPERH